MNLISHAETDDITWLLARLPDATADEQDEFAERVAIAVHDGHLTDVNARTLALFSLKQIKV
jgi:hypothetical protein